MKNATKVFLTIVTIVLASIGFTKSGVAAPTPISTFPYIENFETGTFPPETQAQSASQSSISVTSDAANSSNHGVMFEGGPSSWGGTPTTVNEAYAYTDHVSSLNMVIIPNGVGVPDQFYLEFDHRQGYSFNTNYSWFRVTVNGSPIADVDGNNYYQPVTHSDSWKTLQYDLTPYRNDASISITIQASKKYNFNYYNEGDISMIDNLRVVHLTITDDDNIDDNWEVTYFGDLITADDTTDYDGDGYSDLQEFINHNNGETDPEGYIYDPTIKNIAGGTGYGTGYSHSILIFPFLADFESGSLPGAIKAQWGSESSVYVTAGAAAINSRYGVMMEGNNYTGWFGNSTSTTYTQAYVDNHTHISSLEMFIIPSGENGNLMLEFDHRQNYSITPFYTWFRVLVNGSPVMAVSGNEYFNPSSLDEDDWKTLRYDLTPYQNDSSVSVTLQASNKYNFNYLGSGNVSMVDNLRVRYFRNNFWMLFLPTIQKGGR